MDVISAEVWQKTRSAIKAKLMELGVYIDKELPEYIMMMVCNKRSKSQMEEDLQLFLGSNSAHFTNWLHQVLEKLQEITVPNLDVKKICPVPTKRRSTDEPSTSKKKKKAKSSLENTEKKSDKKSKDIDDAKEIVTKAKSDDSHISDYDELKCQNKETQEKQDEIDLKVEKHDLVVEKASTNSSATVTKVTKEKSPSIGDGDDKEFLSINADLEGEDLMDEESIDEPSQKDLPKTSVKHDISDNDSEKSSPKYRLASSLSSAVKPVEKKTDARVLLNRKTDARELLNRKKAAARLAANDDKHSHGEYKRDRSPQRRRYDESQYDRHSSRRILVSSQDTKSRKFEEDNKDKNVTNRSHNISELKRRLGSDVVVGDLSKDRLKKREEISSEVLPKKSKVISISKTLGEENRSRIKSEAEENKRHGVLSRVVPRRHEPEEDIDTPIPSVIKVTPRPRRPLSQQANHTLILKAIADANKSTSVLTRNDRQQKMQLRTEKDVFRRTKQEIKIPPDKIAVSITNDLVASPDKCNIKEEEEEELKVDNNNIVPELDMNAASENGSKKYKSNCDDVESGDEDTSEMIDEWLKGVDEAMINQTKEKLEEIKLTPTGPTTGEGPQFVVTLNGLDPAMFSSDMDVDDEFEDWDKSKENDDLLLIDDTDLSMIESQEPLSPVVLVKKKTNNNNLVDVMEATNAKPIEKCKYWPNCRTGDQCVYHHPVTPCKAFPACKFGERCLFIHPQCKFNTACLRRGCPYSHSSPIMAVPPKVSKVVQSCRFFPNCANPNCPYLHPKICKFGSYCTKKDCLFTHKEIASIDKLKWSRDVAS